MRLGTNGELLCPVCGGGFNHQVRADLVPEDGHGETGWQYGGRGSTEILMWCEDGHYWKLHVFFHGGTSTPTAVPVKTPPGMRWAFL